MSRYAGIPIHRTKSDAEALALAILAEASIPAERSNELIEGEEADVIYDRRRLIIELDGPQFQRDAHEVAREQRIWEAAGWTVRRLPTDDVYVTPERLVDSARR